MRRLMSALAVPSDPELLQAQYATFARQIPLLYVMLLLNTWVVVSTHFHILPRPLGLYIPLILTTLCLLRIACWWRHRRQSLSASATRQKLISTNWTALLLTACFAGWTASMLPYGDAAMQGHLAFYICLTTIGCIFCVLHLRTASLAIAVAMNIMFILFFGDMDQGVFQAKAMHLALVSAAILFMLQVYYRDFCSLVAALRRTQALSDENLRLANMDSLTQLPNRRRFFSDLQLQFEQAQRNQQRLAVGILNLDGFKSINDAYGRSAGDQLLTQTALRIRNACAEQAQTYRLSGDAFAIMVTYAPDDAALLTLGERLCNAVRQPILMGDGMKIRASASVGFAVYPNGISDAEALFDSAGYALYEGKRSRRGTAILFSAQHNADKQRNAYVTQVMMHADFATELTVHFQPIVDIRSGRILAFEALARWNSPILGNVSPAVFVPIAERVGLINGMTRILLHKSLLQLQQWPAHLQLSFNLSAHDTHSRESAQQILNIIHDSGVHPSRIDLEITETAMLSDIDQTRQALDMLKAAGCKLSLDDFGTGYSSLTQLHSWPLSKIKIDRSFTKDILTNVTSYKIIRSLLNLSQDMQIECVIEGVETREQLEALRQLGCVQVQGYLFSPAVSAQDVPALLQAQSQWQPMLNNPA